MRYTIHEEDPEVNQPYKTPSSIEPQVGDLIEITLRNGSEMRVMCTADANNKNGGYKGDTCNQYCDLGRPVTDALCLHLCMKCNDYIMFKEIDKIMENL